MTVNRRPLTARGVIASTLLGTTPPMLSSRRLVRACELFGIPDGTTRVALSRMRANGELTSHERGYRLAGDLLKRRERQDSGRAPAVAGWEGKWELACVTATGRQPTERSALRTALSTLRLSELREGLWLRPANLVANRLPASRELIEASCQLFTAQPLADPTRLVEQLWDLDGWAEDARELTSSCELLTIRLTTDDAAVLADGFVESAAVLRLLTLDPMLPEALSPSGWPAEQLRVAYDEFDGAYRRVLRTWLDTD